MSYKGKIVYISAIMFAILLQKTLLPVFVGSAQGVNMVMILVLAWTIYDGFNAYLAWAIFSGCIYDIFFHYPFGVHAIFFVAVSYVLSFFAKRFSVALRSSGFFTVCLLIALLTIALAVYDIAWSVGYSKILAVITQEFSGAHFLLENMAVNGAMFCIWYLFIKRLKRFVYYFA